MTYGACQDEEVEYRMHITLMVETVEHRSRDIADAFGDNPDNGSRGNRVKKRFEGHEHRESHAYKTERLDVGMFL